MAHTFMKAIKEAHNTSKGGASLATDGHDLGLGWINLEGCWEREMVPRVWED